MEWELETESGEVFTVYDWKQYEPLEEREFINWHVGAHSKEAALKGKREVVAALVKASL